MFGRSNPQPQQSQQQEQQQETERDHGDVDPPRNPAQETGRAFYIGQSHWYFSRGPVVYPIVCTQPGPGGAVVQVVQRGSFERFDNNIDVSVISIFFCPIIGLLATIKSFQATDRWGQGDIAGARRASASARRIAMAAITIGLVLFIFGLFGNILLLRYMINNSKNMQQLKLNGSGR